MSELEKVNLAKKAVALLILVKPRIGEPVDNYVRRAEAEIAKKIGSKHKEQLSL